jgi:hypothetical protein
VSQATYGFGKQLSQSSGVYALKVIPLIITPQEKVWPIYKGQTAGFGYVWWGGGGGGPVQYNRNIRADVQNSAFYTLQPITVSFGASWIGHSLWP